MGRSIDAGGLKVKTSRRALGPAPEKVIHLTKQQTEMAWRADCPNCSAPIVAMSDVAPNLPTRLPPNCGDGIRCAACGFFSLVLSCEETADHGRRMNLQKIEVPTV